MTLTPFEKAYEAAQPQAEADRARELAILAAARRWAAMRRAYWTPTTFAHPPDRGGPTRAQMTAAERALLEAVES